MSGNQQEESMIQTLIWEQLTQLLQEDKNQLTAILSTIDYLDNKAEILTNVTLCDVLVSDAPIISKAMTVDGYIAIDAQMPFILSVWRDVNQLWRVTAEVIAHCKISAHDDQWRQLNFAAMTKTQLLAHKELIKILRLNYTNVECDVVEEIEE